MAKWIPMITGAIKEGAQKLLSIFSNKASQTTTQTEGTADLPDFPTEPVPTQSQNSPQPGEIASLKATEQTEVQGATTTQSASLPDYQIPKAELPTLPENVSQESRLPEIAESSVSEVGEQKPLPDYDLDLPEWPKAVIGAGGSAEAPQFSPSGTLTQPQVSAPPFPEQQVSQPQQPSSILGADYVIPGYTLTDRLLQQILHQGIPSRKPPRGP